MRNFENHPCFNDKVRHKYARVHLPVAEKCNIQCAFCNRKYDCINESRPGVTSTILTPEQALAYLDKIVEKYPNLSVVGIAGPGDTFASPEISLRTMKMVNQKYPELLLCVATNGLNLPDYIEELSTLNISHVTITINAVDPEIGAKIYPWIRYGKRARVGVEGAQILLENQLKSIRLLKEKGIMVKINCIIIPGINDEHIEEVAKAAAEAGADILNCIPIYPAAGSVFENIAPPSMELVHSIREKAGKHISLMHHCTRCRADAVGLLGESMKDETISLLWDASKLNYEEENEKPCVAVASMEGLLVNQHLGEAESLWIFKKEGSVYQLLEKRKTPERGGGMERWEMLADIISDCRAILINGVGNNPRTVFENKGIKVFEIEGLIEDALNTIYNGGNLKLAKKVPCGANCSGTGNGCG